MFRKFRDLLRDPLALSGYAFMLGFVLIEYANYSTNVEAFESMLVGRDAAPWWVIALALGITVVDLAGIVRLYYMDFDSGSPGVWMALGTWVASALVGAVSTWWVASNYILYHQTYNLQRVLDAGLIIDVVPAFLAAIVLFVRFTLIGALLKYQTSVRPERSFQRFRTTDYHGGAGAGRGDIEPGRTL